MRKRYKYKIKVAPPGAYIETTFTYKELALFALLVRNRLSFAIMQHHTEDSKMLHEASEHINGLLDQIDEDRDKNQTCEKSH